MARYRDADRRWIRSACVAGAYLVGIAILFTLQVGGALVIPVPFAVSAPPLVYAALSMILLREAPFMRRLSWVGGACLTHVVLGLLAALELMAAGGLSATSALAQVFALFAPAPALTLLATPLVVLPFAAPAAPSAPPPRAEVATPRAEVPRQARLMAPPQTPFARAPRGRPVVADPAPVVASPSPAPAAPRAAVPVATPPPAPPTVAPPPALPTVAPPPPPPVVARSIDPVAVPRPAPPPAAPEARSSAEAKKPPRNDVMVRVSFERIAPQLPPEAFLLPFDRLGESLKEPHTLLIPQRVVLAQMGEGGIVIDWATVAPQFPALALGMSEAEFRKRYPDLKLSLPVDEVIAQLPPGTVPLVSAVVKFDAQTASRPIAAAAVPVKPAPPAVERRVEAVDRETVARIVACFNGVGTFEAAGEREGGTTFVSLVAPSLSRVAVAACAVRLLRFLGDANGGEVVTVRTTRAVLVLAAAVTPIVVAARRPGAPVALLELRALRAAVAGDAPLTTSAPPTRPLQAVSVDRRVAGAGHALSSFGDVEPTVFADGGALVYVFSAHGRDATPLGALALSVCEALREGGHDLGALVSVVFRHGGERTLVRPLGTGGAVLAATGPVTRPGCVHRDADRAATVLEAL